MILACTPAGLLCAGSGRRGLGLLRRRPRGPALSGEAALEAAVVLEILGNVLLMPAHLDLEALRYVMWVCKRLEVRGKTTGAFINRKHHY